MRPFADFRADFWSSLYHIRHVAVDYDTMFSYTYGGILWIVEGPGLRQQVIKVVVLLSCFAALDSVIIVHRKTWEARFAAVFTREIIREMCSEDKSILESAGGYYFRWREGRQFVVDIEALPIVLHVRGAEFDDKYEL